MFYQSFGHTNNYNKLVMVYNADYSVNTVIEFQQSFIHGAMSKLFPDAKCIEAVNLQPSEYNRIKRRYSDILETL